jgi:hypothetical protein
VRRRSPKPSTLALACMAGRHDFFHHTKRISAKIRFHFYQCRARPPSMKPEAACAALRFGAVDEISFPYRHY